MIDYAEAVHLRCDNTAGRGDEPVGDDHLLNLLVQDVLHHLKGNRKVTDNPYNQIYLAESAKLLLVGLGLLLFLFIFRQLKTLL